MARSSKSYPINVHYPEGEEDMRNLRNNMGIAYVKFVEEYILNLLIQDEDKNKLYSDVVGKLTKMRE